MKTPTNDRELYLAYRLGELSPKERAAVDDRMLTDDTFSDRLQEAEYDLLDDHRAGRLNSAMRRRVERTFSSDELWQHVTFTSRAKALHTIVSAKPALRFNRTLGIASAVAALLVVAVSWVIAAHLHGGSNSSSSSARTSTPPSSLLQKSFKSPAQTATPLTQLSGETAVLLLAPSVSRGDSSAHLELHSATRAILVQWVVPSGLEDQAYALSVQQRGKQVALVSALDTRHIDGSKVEEFSLPRSVFSAAEPSARYILLVRAPGPAPVTKAEFSLLVTHNSSH